MPGLSWMVAHRVDPRVAGETGVVELLVHLNGVDPRVAGETNIWLATRPPSQVDPRVAGETGC